MAIDCAIRIQIQIILRLYRPLVTSVISVILKFYCQMVTNGASYIKM